MKKRATTDYPVVDLLAERWSPRAFADRAVPVEAVGSLLEAARWAPSSYNDQPWSYLVGWRGDATHAAIASVLVPGNQAWAASAPLLLLSVARTSFTHNGKPNRHAAHDVGAASLALVLQAHSLGLRAHQMAGFDAARAREVFAIPDGHEPLAAIAVGYPGDPAGLPAPLADREREARQRKPLAELAFAGRFGQALSLGTPAPRAPRSKR